jgi:hypothetical protein
MFSPDSAWHGQGGVRSRGGLGLSRLGPRQTCVTLGRIMPVEKAASTVMDGKRLKTFWSNEAEALVRAYRQFETLVPAKPGRRGAGHPGEDGHFVEALVRSYLRRLVPAGIEVLSGFVLRPAVKTGPSGQERRGNTDAHSRQIDIIIYDSTRYPVFQRFEEVAVVPPEGVMALISVKKTLQKSDLKAELQALGSAARLCRCLTPSNRPMRGPFLAVVGMASGVSKPWQDVSGVLKKVYAGSTTAFDEMVGYVGVLPGWSVLKVQPRNTSDQARYIHFDHREDEGHLFFQFLATGILSVIYDKTRNSLRRPGFTAFESGRVVDVDALELNCTGATPPKG